MINKIDMKITLYSLDKSIKILIGLYLLVLTIGVSLGLSYIYLTTEMTTSGMLEQYLGNNNDWSPKLPKTFIDLISHAHNHVVIFSIIFLTLGMIFSFNSIIKGFWKSFLMFEPFFSIIITFGGFFALRFISKNFSYIIIVSSVLMYVCFYIMIFILLYELFIKAQKTK